MRALALFLAASLALSAHAGPKDTVKARPAKQVAPDTWVITGPLGEPSVANQGFMNNPGWVIAGDQIVVIDPGSSLQAGRMVVDAIRKTSKLPVTAVYNTHIHGDHWLGNQAILEAWPNAVLLAHPEMIAKARGGEAETWVGLMERMTNGYTRGTRAVVPTVATSDGLVSKFGTRSFKVISSDDAHSKTDIMILVDNGVLFTGDNVLNGRVGRLDDGTFKGNIAAIDRGLAAEPKIVVPGHGQTGGADVLRAQRTYFQTLYDTVKSEYNAGKSDFEMKPAVVQKLGAYKKWNGFDAAVGRHVSLAILEIEQE